MGGGFLIFVGYSYINWRDYGTFNLTNLGPRHSLVPCLVTENYKNHKDKDLVGQIEKICTENVKLGKSLRGYETTTPVLDLFGNTERERYINARNFASFCIKSDVRGYISYLLDNIICSWKISYSIRNSNISHSKTSDLALSWLNDLAGYMHIGMGFRIMGIAIIASVVKWIRRKKCPWYWLGIAGTLLGIYISVYIGSYADFARLTVYSLPFVYFGILLLVDEVGEAVLSRYA